MGRGVEGRVLQAGRIVPWVVWAVAGCSGIAEEDPWAGTVRDSAGVVLVDNPAQGLWSDGEGWTLEEEVRIGAFDGDPNHQFAQVGSIAVTSLGEILVMDRQIREVRVFSSSGEYLRSFGSPGEGPGQFGMGVADVLVMPGDTVLIPDPRNQRVHRFRSDGHLLGSAPLPMARYRPLRFKWNPSSNRAAVQLRPTETLSDEGGNPSDQIRLLESSGEIGTLLLVVPSGGLLGPNIVRYFTPEPAWALTDSSTVLYAVNSEYRIRAYDSAGQLRRVISRPQETRPITERDIRAFFSYLDRAWLAAGVPPSRLQENHQRVSFAKTFPAFYAFEVGFDGSLWVQPVRAPGDLSDEEIDRYNFLEDFGASGWEVFDRNGRFLGIVSMPPRFQPRLFVDDLIYGVQRDGLDVQYVVRLRLEPGLPAGGMSG